MSRRSIRVLALITTGALLFIMIGLPLSIEEVFITRGVTEGIEWLLAFSFLVVFLFLMISLVHLIRRSHGRRRFSTFEVSMLVLGTVCLIGLGGQKVMLDEVAREMAWGWEWQGEFIILCIVLALQLLYALGFVSRWGERPEAIPGSSSETAGPLETVL